MSQSNQFAQQSCDKVCEAHQAFAASLTGRLSRLFTSSVNSEVSASVLGRTGISVPMRTQTKDWGKLACGIFHVCLPLPRLTTPRKHFTQNPIVIPCSPEGSSPSHILRNTSIPTNCDPEWTMLWKCFLQQNILFKKFTIHGNILNSQCDTLHTVSYPGFFKP